MANSKAKIGNHAIVLGASIAGLLAAQSLADFFDTVTVMACDPLPDPDAVRRVCRRVGTCTYSWPAAPRAGFLDAVEPGDLRRTIFRLLDVMP